MRPVISALYRRTAAERAVSPSKRPSQEPRLQAVVGSHGPQRFAVAPEALAGGGAAQKMLGERWQLASALRGALPGRGAAHEMCHRPDAHTYYGSLHLFVPRSAFGSTRMCL